MATCQPNASSFDANSGSSAAPPEARSQSFSPKRLCNERNSHLPMRKRSHFCMNPLATRKTLSVLRAIQPEDSTFDSILE